MRNIIRRLAAAALSIGLIAPSAIPPASASSYGPCPPATAPVFAFSRTLWAKSVYDSKVHPSNAYRVPPGTYLLRISGGAWSPFASGPYWRVSATTAYLLHGIVYWEPILDPQITFPTPDIARAAVQGGNSKVISVDPPIGGRPNLHLFIADYYPYDNRGMETIEIYRCEPAGGGGDDNGW